MLVNPTKEACMATLPFKVEWPGQFPSARKVRSRLHPLVSQTDAYSRILRAGEILLILPSCVLIALVIVQAMAGAPSRTVVHKGRVASTHLVSPPTVVTVATAERVPVLNIEAQRH
jgi:hypothetical protein